MARAKGVGDLGEVMHVGDRVAIQHHKLGIESLFDFALVGGFKIWPDWSSATPAPVVPKARGA